MTLVDRIIPYQFWFEYGVGKLWLYFSLVTLGISITTLLTVKGIFFPTWGIIPIAITVIVICTAFGWFLDTYQIMGRLTSHMNRKGNPEFDEICKDIKDIKKMLEEQK
jgi:hypothetical protein